ncbi:pyridoxal phosphate-dependent aminotransferase [Mycolicibacterium litorale]|uniref:Aspartate aminotransferase n=1 Tax=Mycolicibacterium litorale TaxID=758802 RepID=A0AAD1II43_9MYCO|nr:aminotransferase class I/II-fold pyridoxal phosphate-dependent enzyme [Mycolicibacterium litorale]MCV7418794.1 aminotransferase class I/II-fold pyridoxal phosphate-dependent enzyme [Mycolicibacterium litorale]TDY00424.1 histidinol-phosphate aminotransferase [Mycolicibacterium litorale]BBY15740.1 aspartate aminotransferase [Mycolicibacterium litorale]
MTIVAESGPVSAPPRPAARALCPLPTAVDPMALALNENPFPPLPAVRTAMIESVQAANRYPEFLPETLRHLIADHLGVPDEQIVVGAGATGVLVQVMHAFTSPGDRVVLPVPTFEGYPIASAMTRLDVVKVPLLADGHHDLDAMAEAASGARLVVVCRPHNPTGTVESLGALEGFLSRLPSDTIVILDEAYVEFVAPQWRIDALALLERFPNVLVLRTFSKAYGLAGLRIGYAIGSWPLTAELWSMQLPFGIANIGLVAVDASYRAENQLRQRIRMITAERRNLRTRLRAMGVASIDGHANFVYLPGGDRPWHEVFDGADGVRVKHCADGGVRITVGGRSSTGAVLAALRRAER